MGIPPGQNIQGTLNKRFVRTHQLNRGGVQRKASSVLFLMVHGVTLLQEHDFLQVFGEATEAFRISAFAKLVTETRRRFSAEASNPSNEPKSGSYPPL